MADSKSALGKLKEGLNEVKTAAGLEIKYATAKRSGFKHAPEMEEQINIMRAIRDEIPKLRERIAVFTSLQKQLAELEDKAGAEFSAMSEAPSQHPKLGQIEKLYADGLTSVAAHRFQLHTTMNEINEEWKQMDADLQELRNKQELCNRALTEYRYWKSQNKQTKVPELENKYKILGTEWVQTIHQVRMKKEEVLPEYVLRMAQAEVVFYRAALQEAERVEASIRNVGPVTPTKFNGMATFKPEINNAIENPAIPNALPQPTPPQPAYEPAQTLSQPLLQLPATSPVSTTQTAESTPNPTLQDLETSKYEQTTTSTEANQTDPNEIPPTAPEEPVSTPSDYPQARGLFPFVAETPQELSFQPGDLLSILSQEGQWWTAMNSEGQAGLIPCNYVQLL